MNKSFKFFMLLSFVPALFAALHSSFDAKRAEMQGQKATLSLLQTEEARLSEIESELSLKIASQGDPAWVELVLMQQLGMVPKGFKKIQFNQP